MMRVFQLFLLAFASLAAAADFTATFLHVNDTHARVEPVIISGKPYGGFARLGTLIGKYRQSDPNPIVLHGGDAFQGTFYFNVYEGLADLTFLNTMQFDGMAVGNHEFDKGPAALALFARNAQFPLLSANVDVREEPVLKDLIKRSTVITRGRERIGIVGGTTELLPQITNPGPNVHLLPLAASIQAEIDALAKTGINKIVLVTHIGYEREQALAKMLHGVDVIVGGHSHTLLGEVTAPGWEKSGGPYPTVVTNADGDKVLVVQAWQGARVLGRMRVTFDSKGRVKKWSDAAPVPVDETVAETPVLAAMVEAYRKPIAQQRDRNIAAATATFDHKGEALGELIADIMKAATEKQGSVAALMNPGGIRASLEKGEVTYGMALAVQPFNNTLFVLDITGAELVTLLNEAREPLWPSAGLVYTIDTTKPAGARVTTVTLAGRPIDPAETYRVTVNNFMAGGGDGLPTLKQTSGYRYDTGILDIDVLADYLSTHSPVTPRVEHRLRTLP